MATLTLRTETSGVRPTFEYIEERQRRAVQSPEKEPQRRHRQINERAVRIFKLRWRETDYGQVDAMRGLFADSLGGVLAMDYTPIRDVDANAVEVCFVEGTLEIEQVAPAVWNMEADVEELH